ncbi:MAG: TRAP transporter substrate-binding protein [Clostridia bacterium]|nr:TRAP transporter substrate-binding protein [Clostridia bacterium]
MSYQMRTKGRKAAALLVLCLVAGLLLAGCGQPSPSPGTQGKTEALKVVELKLAHFWPSSHWIETEVVPAWVAAVEKATNGQVKVTSYPGETLLKAAAIYDGVVQGVADIGMSCYGYTAGRFPVMEALMIPGITYNSAKVASKVAWETAKQLNPKELQDTKHLMVFATGPGALMMKAPVRTLQDLKGVEVGVTAGPRVKALELLGATPVAMPMSEMYEAQSRGVIKGCLGPVEVLKGFRLGEVTNYVTETPFLYNQVFFMVMNQAKWNSLSPEVQNAITEVTDKLYEEKVAGLWDAINESGMKWVQEKKPVEVLTLSAEEQKVWLGRLQTMLDEYTATLNSKGLPGQEIMKTIQDLAAKYNAEYK